MNGNTFWNCTRTGCLSVGHSKHTTKLGAVSHGSHILSHDCLIMINNMFCLSNHVPGHSLGSLTKTLLNKRIVQPFLT